MKPSKEPWIDESGLAQALVDQMPVLGGYFGPDLRVRVANAAYAAWFGVSSHDMRGAHASELLSEEAYLATEPMMERALKGEELDFTRIVHDTAGRPRRVHIRYLPDVVDGRVRGFFSLVTDQTATVEAQRELDVSQDLAHIGSWTHYPRTGEVRWSRQLYRLLGADPETEEPSFETWTQVRPPRRPRHHGQARRGDPDPRRQRPEVSPAASRRDRAPPPQPDGRRHRRGRPGPVAVGHRRTTRPRRRWSRPNCAAPTRGSAGRTSC